MISAFPKILQLGHRLSKNIFNGEIEITEKIDGSQFCFGKIDGILYIRSKGKHINIEYPDKMFKDGVDYIISVKNRLPDGYIYYAEYLQKPKHNVLSYKEIPHNHLALFGVYQIESNRFIENFSDFANTIDIDVAPILYTGTINLSGDELIKFFNSILDNDSYLGNSKIEGFVIKNYNEDYEIGGKIYDILAVKYVSEKFKEKHNNDWKKEHTSKGKWEVYKENFRTGARWNKAIQHLKEKGLILNEPKDIGLLIKEIQNDIIEEEIDDIKDWLWNNNKDELLRCAIHGFPEWYKNKLLGELCLTKNTKS